MADGKRFVVECRWVYASSCYGSLTIPCTKLLKNVGRGGRDQGPVLVAVVAVPRNLAITATKPRNLAGTSRQNNQF